MAGPNLTASSRIAVALAAGLGFATVPSVVHAQAAAFAMPGAAIATLGVTCPITPVRLAEPPTSKASAILGGAASALESIRSKQSARGSFGPLLPGAPPPDAQPRFRPLEPAAAPSFASRDCTAPTFGTLNLALPNAAASRPVLGSGNDDFLGSRRIAISRTFFDADWQRVRQDRPGMPAALAHLASDNADPEAKLGAVNRWVNDRIAYTEDRELFGRADHWAGPRQTLALGKGDCEDYALLKMHLLAAAGIPRKDMYLTIARDLVRRADHAVLVVRTGSGFRMLDNATDRVLDAGTAFDYRPVLSFSEDKSWLHGYAP